MSDIEKIAKLIDEDISSDIIGDAVEIRAYQTYEGLRDMDLHDMSYYFDSVVLPDTGYMLIEIEDRLIDEEPPEQPANFHDEDEFSHRRDSEWYMVIYTPKSAPEEHVKLAMIKYLRN